MNISLLLKDCVEILDSKRIPLSKEERQKLEKIYPYYGAQEIIDYVDDYLFDGDYILVAEDGNNLKSRKKNIATWVEGKFWVNNHAHILGKKDGFHLKYIYYLLNAIDVRGYITGSAQPKLNQKNLANIKLSIPSYDQQKKIVQPLDILDKKISINNSIISKLEEMAKMIYEYWFLQFDFPNHEGKPYASSGGAMKYSEELGREIPTDWEVENFYKNSLFSLVPTGVEKFSTKRYLATADVVGTNIGEGKQVEYETRETRANMQPRINSVWFAKMKNSTKHLFLNKEMGFLIEKCILSTGFFGLQCSETSFEYIASTISYPSFEIKKDSLAHGATQEAVNQDDLQSIKLLIPNTFVLEKFHELTKPLYGYISQMRHENQKLTQLRDWLLPMLMNGQVRVE